MFEAATSHPGPVYLVLHRERPMHRERQIAEERRSESPAHKNNPQTQQIRRNVTHDGFEHRDGRHQGADHSSHDGSSSHRNEHPYGSHDHHTRRRAGARVNIDETTPVTERLRGIVRRRRRLLTLLPLGLLLLSVTAAYLIPPKFTSSTSILVHKEETLNPLVMYQMAVTLASEDRLKSFNEIIFSRSTVQMLIDSLGLDQGLDEPGTLQSLVDQVRASIKTQFRASDSFDISFTHSDPLVAMTGVQLLADHFISTRLSLENNRNEQTVLFFEEKEKELQQIVDRRQTELLSASLDRMQVLPSDEKALQTRLEEVEESLRELRWSLYEERREKEALEAFLREEAHDELWKVYRFRLDGYAFDADLENALLEFEDVRRRFTANHPGYRNAQGALLELVQRIPQAIAERIESHERQVRDLEKERMDVIASMEMAMVANRIQEGPMSEYSIYRTLLEEMKVKLEQARINRDLSRKAVDQFVVLDAPFLPEEPSSPNRKWIILTGAMFGFLLGFFTTALAEYSDTTVRQEEDLEEFDRPVIAFLGDGS